MKVSYKIIFEPFGHPKKPALSFTNDLAKSTVLMQKTYLAATVTLLSDMRYNRSPQQPFYVLLASEKMFSFITALMRDASLEAIANEIIAICAEHNDDLHPSQAAMLMQPQLKFVRFVSPVVDPQIKNLSTFIELRIKKVNALRDQILMAQGASRFTTPELISYRKIIDRYSRAVKEPNLKVHSCIEILNNLEQPYPEIILDRHLATERREIGKFRLNPEEYLAH